MNQPLVADSPRLTTNRAIDLNAKFHEELRAKRKGVAS